MTGAIVVHHRNFPDVLVTVTRLLDEGILPSLLVVIDNSDDPSLLLKLRAALPEQSTLEAVPNLGYGPAVNRGIETLLRLAPTLSYILVSTHETYPAEGVLDLLEQALDSDPSLAVVGPTLITTRDQRTFYWSWGGIRSRLLNEPRHVGHEATIDEPLARSLTYRAWLDGAFCLYRARVLEETKFRDDFFLYFEETELHARLVKAGHTVGWVPAARVEQRSDGVPPFLLARNLQRFQRLHGSAIQRIITVPFVICRRTIRKLVRGGSHKEVR